MTTSSSANHPPLAHADDGTQLPLPAGTTHWRIVSGGDTEPARFGLEMTREGLLELCGPGTYQIEASDQFGHRLDHVTTVTVGGSRRPLFDDDFDDYGPPWRLPPRDSVEATTLALRTLSPEEQAVVMSTLLLKMSPAEAARVLRTYLVPDKNR